MKEKLNISYLKNEEIPDIEFYKNSLNKFEEEIILNNLNDYNAIKKLFVNTLNIHPPMILTFNDSSDDLLIYRARIVNEELEDTSNIDTFSYFKKREFVSIGRANIKEYPVFYGAIDQDSAMRESKDNVQPGQTLFVGKWKIKENVEYQLCNLIFETENSILGEFPKQQNIEWNAKFSKRINIYVNHKQESIKYLNSKLGSYFLENDYRISSFISHYLLYEQIDNETFKPDMIWYPSKKSNFNSYNFAIAPHFVDNNMELVEVYKYKVTKFNEEEQGTFVNILQKGKVENGKIEWYERGVLLEKNIRLNSLGLVFEDGSVENIEKIKVNEGYILEDDTKISMDEFYRIIIPAFLEEISKECLKSIEKIKEDELYNEFEINININVDDDKPIYFIFEETKAKIVMLITNFKFKLEDVKINGK
jgi:hypothetical protein